MTEAEYGVYSPFDLEKHKEKFVHYLEVMVERDGTVHYAVPSHQEWAIAAACRALGISRDELCARTPQEYYFDWLTWLLAQSGAMAVWESHYECPKPSREQYAVLREMKLAGVYRGPLPKKTKAIKQ